MTHGHYVELLSVVVFIINIDTFHLGLNIPLEQLPKAKSGKPTNYIPKGLELKNAWVPMLNTSKVEDSESDLFADINNKATNVLLALSCVPDSTRCQRYLENRYYLPPSVALDVRNNGGLAITRKQIEFVATRVSINNQCFYCATSHGMMLDVTGEIIGERVDINVIKDTALSGVENSELIGDFVDNLMQGIPSAINQARQAIDKQMSSSASVDIAALVGSFQRMNRIANATGISLDGVVNALSSDVQEKLELRSFDTAKTSNKASKIAAFLAKKVRGLLFKLLSMKNRRFIFCAFNISHKRLTFP